MPIVELLAKQANSLPDSNFRILVTMICNYKIIRKQNNKGVFTHYISTEGEGVSKMFMHDYRG